MTTGGCRGRWAALMTSVVFSVVTIAAGIAYLRTHGLSARAKPSALEAYIARKVRSLATPARVRDRRNPLESTLLNVAEGRDHFADHCAICHGNNGDGRTMIGGGLYPPPPDLRGAVTQSLTDGELFSIIRDGIRLTGMPGWGGEDDDNWKLVLFVRHLPNLTTEELTLMNEVNKLEGDVQVDR